MESANTFSFLESPQEPHKIKGQTLKSKDLVREGINIWDMISASRLNSGTVRQNQYLIKVFIGGKSGIQLTPFEQALHRVISEYTRDFNPGLLEVKVEFISTTTVSKHKWLPKHLIDNLLDSDMHFILTHIHQGLTAKNIGWLIQPLLDNLERLKYHPGFPNGKNLQCPIFTQDKMKYIKAIKSSIPSFKLQMVSPGESFPPNDIFEIIDWCKSLEDIHTNGWVVKAPFTTNSHYVKFPKTIDKLIKVIQAAPENTTVGFNQIPYLMVQPCMHNRKEYKVVLLNHQPVYISSLSNSTKRCSNGVCKAFIGEDKSELLSFCQAQVEELKENCPEAITDGLFRVDVLQTADGSMVVNEFESFEANHFGKIDEELFVGDFLFRYWLLKIRHLFDINFKIASESRHKHFSSLSLLSTRESIMEDILNEGKKTIRVNEEEEDESDDDNSYTDSTCSE